MTASKNAASLQDLQIEFKKAKRAMRPWLEEAGRRSRNPSGHAILLAVEHVQRNYGEEAVQELTRRQRPLLPSNQSAAGDFWPSLR